MYLSASYSLSRIKKYYENETLCIELAVVHFVHPRIVQDCLKWWNVQVKCFRNNVNKIVLKIM